MPSVQLCALLIYYRTEMPPPHPQSCAHKVETKREKLCLLCFHTVFSLHYHRLLLLLRPALKNVWASEMVQETGPQICFLHSKT